MLQEAVLREAVKFQYDASLGSEVAVAIVNEAGNEIMDLRKDWLPINIYGESDYTERVTQLRRRRYYGLDSSDKAGILRYTKVTDTLMDLSDIPEPQNERELAWLLSFSWNVDEAYNSLKELSEHLSEGYKPIPHLLRELRSKYESGLQSGLEISSAGQTALSQLGLI